MKEFKNKVAVITGAGRGMGRGVALRCAEEGMKVVLAGYSKKSITNTAEELKSLGAETLAVQTDVSQLEDVENLVKTCYLEFGRVDLLINNAGVAAPGSVLDLSLDDWNWVMGVNFYGILYSVKSFVPRMMAQNHGGHVVNVSSLAGIVPGIGSYWVSKHAVVVLTESLYYDLADTAPQIKISVYCPGWVDTQFYLADKSRPERFNGNPGQVTDEQRAKWREAHEKGVPITQAVDIIFEGIQKDKLFIGPKAFQIHEPQLASAVRDRAEWILNEINP